MRNEARGENEAARNPSSDAGCARALLRAVAALSFAASRRQGGRRRPSSASYAWQAGGPAHRGESLARHFARDGTLEGPRDPGRHSSDQHVRGHVPRHHRAGGDDRASPHAHAGKDDRAGPDPDAVLDAYRSVDPAATSLSGLTDLVMHREEGDVVPHVDPSPDPHRRRQVDTQRSRDVTVVADRQQIVQGSGTGDVDGTREQGSRSDPEPQRTEQRGAHTAEAVLGQRAGEQAARREPSWIKGELLFGYSEQLAQMKHVEATGQSRNLARGGRHGTARHGTRRFVAFAGRATCFEATWSGVAFL